MSYPWPFSTKADVEIDAEDVLDYVKDNREWFLEALSDVIPEREVIKEAITKARNVLNDFDLIRRCRDKASNNRDLVAVKLYEAVESLCDYLEAQQ